MTAILLTALFCFSAMFALCTLMVSWAKYGRSMFDTRAALAGCGDVQEFAVRVTETSFVQPFGKARDTVIPFRRAKHPCAPHVAVLRPPVFPEQALRAAA